MPDKKNMDRFFNDLLFIVGNFTKYQIKLDKMSDNNFLIEKKKPLNRQDKRKYDKELNWLTNWYLDVIIPLERDFWKELLEIGKDKSGPQYVDCYKRYLDKFISARDNTNHLRIKFHFFDSDVFYWEKLYKPIEGL